jgi:phage I-like protein
MTLFTGDPIVLLSTAAAEMGTLGKPLMGTDPKDWKWVQVAQLGRFAGHASGPFELTTRTFDEIVANFENDGLPVPWDFEHASEQDPTEGTVPLTGTPAQGWIHALENRGAAGLWALVEWGPLAKEYVQSGKYKFCSPAIRFGCKDRVTGKPIGARLSSVALTGSPFLRDMEPLAAKDTDGLSHSALTKRLMTDQGMSYAAAYDRATEQLMKQTEGSEPSADEGPSPTAQRQRLVERLQRDGIGFFDALAQADAMQWDQARAEDPLNFRARWFAAPTDERRREGVR